MTEFQASGSVTLRIDNLDSVGDDVASEVERGFGSVSMQGGGRGGRGGRGRRRARRVARATQDSRDELSSQTGLLEDIVEELGDGSGGGGGGGSGGGDGLLGTLGLGALGSRVAGGIGGSGLFGGLAGRLPASVAKGGGALAGLSAGGMVGEALEDPVRQFSSNNVDVPEPAQNIMEAGATPFAGIFDTATGLNDVLGQSADLAGGPLGIGDGSFDLGEQFTRTKELADRSSLIPDDFIGDVAAYRTEGDDGPETASATGQAGSSSGMGGRIDQGGGSNPVSSAATSAAAMGQSAIDSASAGAGGSTVTVNAPVTVSMDASGGDVEREVDRKIERVKQDILRNIPGFARGVSEQQFERFQTKSP